MKKAVLIIGLLMAAWGAAAQTPTPFLPGSSLTTTATGGSVSRTSADRAGTVLNALDVTGVDPTGAADSTTALATYMAATSAPFLPRGTYSVCNLTVPNTVTTIRGEGRSTVLQVAASCNNPAIRATCGIAHTGSTTSGSAIVTGLVTASFSVGGQLYGTGLFDGATVLSIDSGTQIHMSANALATGTPMITETPPNSRLEIYGLSIDGGKANQTQDGSVPAHGIYAINCPELSVHDMDLRNVAGHGIFISNPADSANLNNVPGGYSRQSVYGVNATNIGNARGGTYGSCFDVTNGNRTKFENNVCSGVAKAGYRISGNDIQLINDVSRYHGNDGVAPVAGSVNNLNVVGGSFTDGFSYSDTGVTGTASGSTLTLLSADVLTRPGSGFAGWQNSDVVTDTGGCLPATAPYAYISAISSDGLTVTLTGTITGTCTNDTFTDTGAASGARIIGANNVSLTGATFANNAGNGVDCLNGCANLNISGGKIFDNGQAATLPVGPTDGRSGVECYDTGTASTNMLVSGVQFFDDQTSHTQVNHVETLNLCATPSVQDNFFDANATGGAVNISANAAFSASSRVGYGNTGLTANKYDNTSNTINSTSPTTVVAVAVAANELGKGSVWDFTVNGTLTGTAGTKTLAFNNSSTGGNGTTNLFTAVAATTGAFSITCEIIIGTTTTLHGTCNGATGTVSVPLTFTQPSNFNTALLTTWSLTVTDASAVDTFLYRSAVFKRVQ